MPSLDIDTILGWRGRTVRDRDGEKIGKLEEIFLDADTDRPAYAGIRTGLFGRHSSIVPLAAMRERDDDLVVPYEKRLVEEAPHLDPDAELSPEEADALGRHYREGAAPGDGDAMVLSEEEPRVVGTERVPTERIRIKRVKVTEERPVTIPRRKEVAQLETEPPPEGAEPR